MFKTSQFVPHQTDLAKVVTEHQLLKIERIYLQERSIVDFPGGKWIPIGVESYGRWKQNPEARKSEAKIRFALQPATWHLPAQYITDGGHKFTVDEETQKDVAILEQAVQAQLKQGATLRSILSEKKWNDITIPQIKTKINKPRVFTLGEDIATCLPSTMDALKACPKRVVEVRLVITGVFHNKEGYYQLSSRVEQILWKDRVPKQEENLEDLSKDDVLQARPTTPQPPPAKKVRKSSNVSQPSSNKPQSQKREVWEKTKKWTVANVMKWLDEFLNQLESATGMIHQSDDDDDLSNLIEAYNRLQVREEVEAWTTILLNEVNHLPSFIKRIEKQLDEQSRRHHSTYSAQPPDPAGWYVMRTEQMEIRAKELFLNILKAAYREARLRYTVGAEQEKIAKEYYDFYQAWSKGDEEEEIEDEEDDRMYDGSMNLDDSVHQYLAHFVRNRCHTILALYTPKIELENIKWHKLLTPFLEMVNQAYWHELRYQMLLVSDMEPHLMECVQHNCHVQVAKSKRFLRDCIIWAIKYYTMSYTAEDKTGLADARNRSDYLLIMKTVEKRARELFTSDEWITIKGQKGVMKKLNDLLNTNSAVKSEYDVAFADFDQWSYENARYHDEKCSVCGRWTCVNCPSEPCTAHV